MGIFKKIKSLKDSFAKASRRWATVTTLTGGSIFSSVGAIAQTQTAPANNNTAKTKQVSKTAPRLSADQRAKINEDLIQQGQDQYLEVLPFAEDSYSCWLQDLQKYLNGRLQESDPDSNIRVVVLDPIQMDVGIGLGLSPERTAELMLQANGIDPDPSLVFDVTDALTGMGYISAANDTTYTQIPMTIPLDPDSQGNVVRIVIPMSDYAPIVDIPGLSKRETEVTARTVHNITHKLDDASARLQRDRSST